MRNLNECLNTARSSVCVGECMLGRSSMLASRLIHPVDGYTPEGLGENGVC